MQKAERTHSNGHDRNHQSISHALRVLNSAATDSADELKKMMRQNGHRLKDMLAETKPTVTGVIAEIKDVAATTISDAGKTVATTAKNTAARVNDAVYQNPWKFIAGTAVFCSLAGMFLGRKASRR